jgi:hypothetical protein
VTTKAETLGTTRMPIASNCRTQSTAGLPETEKTTTNTNDASTSKGTFNMVKRWAMYVFLQSPFILYINTI